ncbi:argonaute/piwi family protein [Rhizobium phaseoli]|uniref:argonaute/piwi family protein n=1 Tax=Rhizobium phaseoli TaxID=396 RepID=UPI00031AC40E|nr:hypothetical protein [Rhizobium phaseoli]KKZ86593.1 hypothetical protein RPHASCH2410_CH15815 [Rhizobium phaseoli Ch24-10]
MNLTSRLSHFAEPLLEFGSGGRHVDVRFGLAEYGPVDFDPENPRTVRIGIVGSRESAGKFQEWLSFCENGIPAKKSRQPNLFPMFGGSSSFGPFRCNFEADQADVRSISSNAISKICLIEDDAAAVDAAVQAYAEELQSIAERDRPPHVVVCALPVEIIERVSNMRRAADGEDEVEPEPSEGEDLGSSAQSKEMKNFRGSLKAISLRVRVPIQIVWPTTYDNSAVVKRKLAQHSTRRVQDEATRAWNLFCALYYKAGGTPWRMIREKRDYSSTYMGVSFYEGIDRRSLKTSSAQLFDERGEGLILRGGTAKEDKSNRQPYLSAEDAHTLTVSSLKSYKREHGNYPARLVVHKTSRFHPEELEGFNKAIEAAEIDYVDLLWLPNRSPVKLFRDGVYPPLRGTAMRVDDARSILYTRGSVDFFRTYPGMYVPNPLMLHAQRQDTSSWDQTIRETLALTKMNWNGTQFDGALPITLKAAKQVGEILKYVEDDQPPDPRYRFYM